MKELILFDEIIKLKSVNSTSKYAEKLIRKNEISGNCLVIAEKQFSGIGRSKNKWFSPDGGLYVTACLYGLSVDSSLTIFTGICIHKALMRLFQSLKDDLKIKWPNDIFLKNKKLSGILSIKLSTENYHLIGIGLNSNIENFSEEISGIAISLKQELGGEVSNEKIIEEMFQVFADDLPHFIENGLDLEYYKKYSLLIGKTILLDTSFDRFQGKMLSINKDGAILLKLKSGMIQPFYAGSVVQYEDEKNN